VLGRLLVLLDGAQLEEEVEVAAPNLETRVVLLCEQLEDVFNVLELLARHVYVD
jgi:hypothetical protein